MKMCPSPPAFSPYTQFPCFLILPMWCLSFNRRMLEKADIWGWIFFLLISHEKISTMMDIWLQGKCIKRRMCMVFAICSRLSNLVATAIWYFIILLIEFLDCHQDGQLSTFDENASGKGPLGPQPADVALSDMWNNWKCLGNVSLLL